MEYHTLYYSQKLSWKTLILNSKRKNIMRCSKLIKAEMDNFSFKTFVVNLKI